LVKLDATTGALIWEIILPGDAMSGPRAGYESIAFTADGGFIAGGFTNYEGNFPSFKSGGQIDSGNPIFQKFNAATAAATEAFVTMPTPDWTYKCGDTSLGAVNCPATVQAAVNTMRVFNDAGAEKVAATFRPSLVVVFDSATVAELAFQDVPAVTDMNDKYQDLEVEIGADGAVTGYVYLLVYLLVRIPPHLVVLLHGLEFLSSSRPIYPRPFGEHLLVTLPKA